MQKVMIHRPLPTREFRMVGPGEYGISPGRYGMTVHSLGYPSIIIGSMDVEQFARAELEGWLTNLDDVIPGWEDNPFKGVGEVTVSRTEIAVFRGVYCVERRMT